MYVATVLSSKSKMESKHTSLDSIFLFYALKVSVFALKNTKLENLQFK
jgi:hypothetical protein